MAHINKNGRISGAVGDLVFVNNGDRHYVRTRPEQVKQSMRTKAAAKVFGLVSTREKRLRWHLQHKLGIPPLQYLAARHRARLQKTITGGADSAVGAQARFGLPDALIGFDFNPKMEWHRFTNIFPVYEKTAMGGLTVRLPELRWATHFKAPKKSTSAVMTLTAFSTDLNEATVPVNIRSTITFEINRHTPIVEQVWSVPGGSVGEWLLIAGVVRFTGTDTTAANQVSAAYLWAYGSEGTS